VRAGTLARLSDLVAPAPHEPADDAAVTLAAREPTVDGLPLFDHTPAEPDS
jgi:hypothetical protein